MCGRRKRFKGCRALIEKADWIKVVGIKDEILKKSLMFQLDEGESETIVLALEKKVELVLIDDYDGKELARAMGLNVTGTIGILLRAKFKGKIGSLKEELDKLKATGFWLSEELYKRILEEVGEG